MEIKVADVVLCQFYFSDLKKSKSRPVLVLKDNLPFNDFVAIPISSKIDKLQDDEVLLQSSQFENGKIPKDSKLMMRKPFVVSKNVVLKRYGTLSRRSFEEYHNLFCQYFNCKK